MASQQTEQSIETKDETPNVSEEPRREVYIPGQAIEGTDIKPGNGTYYYHGKIYAAQLGIKSIRSNYVNIIPLGGRYMPHKGDAVVGIIEDISATNWLVDINSPYPAPLHANEVPWKVEFGDTSRFLNVGDTVIVEVLSVDEMKKVQVTMNNPETKKISQGQIVEIPPSKVPRVIGKAGSMIKMIVTYTKCRLFVGQNGRIWIDGDPANMIVAMKAIKKIEAESQVLGLTDSIKLLLETEMKKIYPQLSTNENIEQHQ
jgi:exosome complex component RRP4